MSGIIPKSELVKFVSQDHYFNAVVAQLQKDFNTDEFDQWIADLAPLNFNQLQSKVAVYLTELFDHNSENLFQLIYRVDIPEVDFQGCVNGGSVDFYELSELFLRRELLKILLREKFSSL